MGILNTTPDSFSDGGAYTSTEAAIRRALEMVQRGAAIVDIGGESTRPGSDPVSVGTELDRVLPVLKGLPKDRFIISVDSSKLEVQEAALQHGAHIINDIMGGSPELFKLAEAHRAGLVLMHTPAPPKTMQAHTDYTDVVTTVHAFFKERQTQIRQHALPAVWLDPGIGFGKTLDQNIALLRALPALRMDGCGLLLGASRKSWIGQLCDAPVDQRIGGSIAALVHAAIAGVDLFRVHDVFENAQALAVTMRLVKDNASDA